MIQPALMRRKAPIAAMIMPTMPLAIVDKFATIYTPAVFAYMGASLLVIA